MDIGNQKRVIIVESKEFEAKPPPPDPPPCAELDRPPYEMTLPLGPGSASTAQDWESSGTTT